MTTTRSLLTVITAALLIACGSDDAADPVCDSDVCALIDTRETLTCFSHTYSYEVQRTGLQLAVKCSAAGDLDGKAIKVPDTTQVLISLGEEPGAWPTATCGVRFLLDGGPFVYAEMEANDLGTADVAADHAAADFRFDRCDYSGVLPL